NSRVLIHSFLLVVLGCLAWTSNAQDALDARSQQVLDYFANPAVSQEDRMKYSDQLLAVYEQYRNSIPASSHNKANADYYLALFRQQQAAQVDDVPLQGGIWNIVAMIIPYAVNALGEVISKAISS
ncbi:hypothetical protein KR018_002776, partial [Drosophila ironensis]